MIAPKRLLILAALTAAPAAAVAQTAVPGPPPIPASAIPATAPPAPPSHDEVCATISARYDRLYDAAQRSRPAKRSFLSGVASGLGSAAIGGLTATAGVGALGRVAMAGGGVMGTQMTAAAVNMTAGAANSAIDGRSDPMEGMNSAMGTMSLVQAMSRANTEAIEQDCPSPAAKYGAPRRRGLFGQ